LPSLQHIGISSDGLLTEIFLCWPIFFLSHHSSVSVVTGLWDGQFQQYGLISDRGSGFHCCAPRSTLNFVQP